MTNTIDVRQEPKGKAYRQLIALASEMCASFSLVWRDESKFAPSADEIACFLRPFLIKENRTNEWPGTKVFDQLASVRHYRMSTGAVAVLERVEGLYSWLGPALPEDLAFYTSDETLWLGSIAHERDAWFKAEPTLEAILRTRLPYIELIRREAEE